MIGRSERIDAQARGVAQFLDEQREHKRAEDIRRLCRSNSSTRATLEMMHGDAVMYRAALRQILSLSDVEQIHAEASGALERGKAA